MLIEQQRDWHCRQRDQSDANIYTFMTLQLSISSGNLDFIGLRVHSVFGSVLFFWLCRIPNRLHMYAWNCSVFNSILCCRLLKSTQNPIADCVGSSSKHWTPSSQQRRTHIINIKDTWILVGPLCLPTWYFENEKNNMKKKKT